jgi:hypothetical protein
LSHCDVLYKAAPRQPLCLKLPFLSSLISACLDRRVLGCIALHGGDYFSFWKCDPGLGQNTPQYRSIQTKPKRSVSPPSSLLSSRQVTSGRSPAVAASSLCATRHCQFPRPSPTATPPFPHRVTDRNALHTTRCLPSPSTQPP